jgi:hypothetical protein
MVKGFLILAIVGFIYFIPSIYARSQHRRNTAAIFLLNLFLGWTLIGWIIACIWAEMKDPQPASFAAVTLCGQCRTPIPPGARFCAGCGGQFL